MATKRTRHDAADDDNADEEEPHPPPVVTPTVVSTKETDFCGRALVTPGTDSKDYLGRATTATADHLGRLLLDV